MSDTTRTDVAVDLSGELRRIMPGIPEEDLPRFLAAVTTPGPYAPAAEATARAEVPQGRLLERRFVSRSVFPGVERDVRVYLPAGTRANAAAALMVFQDGSRYLGPEVGMASVFDNLIAAADIPPIVGLFVEPGETGPGLPIYGGTGNRSIEYDSLGDAYVRFLIDELIPEVTRDIAIADGPQSRAIVGLSSGGICAFNAAWERPDYFGKVVSHCGSFVDIRGGHLLPAQVRREPRKRLRVFLQTGEHDLDILFGSWLLGNRQLASALEYRGYDYQFVVGQGGHSLAHGGALIGETLRWLWRDWRDGGSVA